MAIAVRTTTNTARSVQFKPFLHVLAPRGRTSSAGNLLLDRPGVGAEIEVVAPAGDLAVPDLEDARAGKLQRLVAQPRAATNKALQIRGGDAKDNAM